MNKRLQVLIDKKEYKTFMRIAKAAGLSLGEWVRQSLRKALSEKSLTDHKTKMAKIHKLARSSNLKSGEIEEILEQIESGRNR
jgi:uncharacterized protein (DUF2344 family)